VLKLVWKKDTIKEVERSDAQMLLKRRDFEAFTKNVLKLVWKKETIKEVENLCFLAS
jgi:hypothetical protein